MPGTNGFPRNSFFTAFKTRLGWMALAASDAGVTDLTLPYPSEQAAIDALPLANNIARESNERFSSIISRIKRYMDGKQEDLSSALDLSAGTLFQQQVWMSCKSIPYGQTRSYSWIARDIGKPGAARAVGNALNKNPIPIVIPCHRVIAADGGIGGFGGGIGVKRQLLALEQINLNEN